MRSRTTLTLDHDGDGVLEYAQKLVSSEGLTDGLYWPADQGDGESPAGAAINQAALDKSKEGKGYFGYHFKILKRQGENIAGGKYDYVINGNMIAGFALVAWPVNYAETGRQHLRRQPGRHRLRKGPWRGHRQDRRGDGDVQPRRQLGSLGRLRI